MVLSATCYFFLGLAALATTGCAADRNPEPLPAPTARYHRTVAYLDAATPTRADTEYAATKVAVSAEQTAGYLTVQLRLKDLRGEGLSFRVARAQLTAAMVGTYGYKTKLDRTPPTDFTYTVQPPDYVAAGSNTLWAYWDYQYAPTGTFTLTAYDAPRRLLSGRFAATWPNVHDPLAASTVYPPRRGDIILDGTFANVLIQEVQ